MPCTLLGVETAERQSPLCWLIGAPHACSRPARAREGGGGVNSFLSSHPAVCLQLLSTSSPVSAHSGLVSLSKTHWVEFLVPAWPLVVPGLPRLLLFRLAPCQELPLARFNVNPLLLGSPGKLSRPFQPCAHFITGGGSNTSKSKVISKRLLHQSAAKPYRSLSGNLHTQGSVVNLGTMVTVAEACQ